MLDPFSSQAPPRHRLVLCCFVQYDREDKQRMGHLIVTMRTVMSAEHVTRILGPACCVSSVTVVLLYPLLLAII